MKFSDPPDIAAHCARAAMGMMDRHGVAAHPHNFTVWYAFVADRNPDLSKAVNGILRSGQKFTDDICAQLYDQFFGGALHEAQLQAVGKRVEDAVSRVLQFLGAANQGASDYGAVLESVSGELQANPSPSDLVQLVTTMLSETRTMIDLNRDLEHRLETSTTEISRLRDDLDQLRREATTDALTGLSNRKLFDATLRETSLDAEEQRSFLSLLMIDVDHFKQFNDTHGHLLGDQVLKLVAKTMLDAVASPDTAARYGGEEFAVILPNTRLADAVEMGETIRRMVAGRKLMNRRSGQVVGQVTLSVGVAEYEFGESLGAFVHRADESLYLAKRTGRNRVCSQIDLHQSGNLDFQK